MGSFLFCFLVNICFFFVSNTSVYDTKKLKILVAVNAFPVTSEVFILNQVAGLIDQGHDVGLFAYVKAPNQITHRLVGDYDLLHNVTYGAPTEFFLKKFDVILCQFGNVGKRFAQLKKKYNLKAKLVTLFRGYDASSSIRYNAHLYDDLFKIGDLFLPVCENFRKKLIALGAPLKKTKVLYSGVDISLFAFKAHSITDIDKEHINIMTVARLVPKKGHTYILKALPTILKKYPKVQYTIIGSGPLKKKLQKMVCKLGLTRNVHFVNAVSHHTLCKVLDRADIFVLPSVVDESGNSEGIPCVLMEAMALGVPVVSTYHAGIPELVEHGITGFLAPEKDVNALAQEIIYAIEHQDKCMGMVHNARQKIMLNYTKEKECSDLAQLLLQVVKEEPIYE